MNAYLMLGALSSCTLIFAAVVWGLVALGVSVPLAIVLVYLGVLLWMRGMQQRAQGPYGLSE